MYSDPWFLYSLPILTLSSTYYHFNYAYLILTYKVSSPVYIQLNQVAELRICITVLRHIDAYIVSHWPIKPISLPVLVVQLQVQPSCHKRNTPRQRASNGTASDVNRTKEELNMYPGEYWVGKDGLTLPSQETQYY